MTDSFKLSVAFATIKGHKTQDGFKISYLVLKQTAVLSVHVE
jgi:hypothetical protein